MARKRFISGRHGAAQRYSGPLSRTEAERKQLLRKLFKPRRAEHYDPHKTEQEPE